MEDNRFDYLYSGEIREEVGGLVEGDEESRFNEESKMAESKLKVDIDTEKAQAVLFRAWNDGFKKGLWIGLGVGAIVMYLML